MTDPYVPPESSSEEVAQAQKPNYKAPIIGCLSGGCLAPILLLFGCAIFLGDTGGPLFWPFVAVILGVVGMVFGFIYRAMRK